MRTILVAFCLLAAVVLSRVVPCTERFACFPWSIGVGPYCGRANRINLRFTLDLAPENRYEQYGTTPPTEFQQASYGFCPLVDELQAFNLSAAPVLAGMKVDNFNITNVNHTASNFSTLMQDGYVYAFGFGGVDNVNQPNATTSTGAVKVVANDTLLCPGGILVSQFLVLAISLDAGKFKYSGDRLNPIGTGFQSTCSGGVCLSDSTQQCIGNELGSNCARCFTNPIDMVNATIQIWVAYYGTDVNGRTLLSGANNPLNFQKFSSSGVWSNLKESANRLESGEIIGDGQLGPTDSQIGG